MSEVYIYEYHDRLSIYLSNRVLAPSERYCSHCGASDRLLMVCEEKDLPDILNNLSWEYEIIDRGYS